MEGRTDRSRSPLHWVEPLIADLEATRWTGRPGYPIRTMVGMVLVGLLWGILSATVAKDLPSPAKTWEESKRYIVEPWEKRGEMDQGILRMASYSLLRVAKEALLVPP